MQAASGSLPYTKAYRQEAKLICVLANPIDLANYIDVWNLYKNGKSKSVCHISWADLSGMQPHETLYLLGHGNINKIEKYTAKELAKTLVDHGLTDDVEIDEIKLLVCQSGRTTIFNLGRLEGINKQPFCQTLADALVEAGGPATVVIGYDGATTVTDDRGETYAKDIPQSKYKNFEEFKKHYSSLMSNYDTTAKLLTFGSGEKILKDAKDLALQTEKAFQWLYENNSLHVKTDMVGATYGIPGQKIDHVLLGGKFYSV